MLATLHHNAANGDQWAQYETYVATGENESRDHHPAPIACLTALFVVLFCHFYGFLHFLAAARPSGGWSTVELVENLRLALSSFRHQIFESKLLLKYLKHATINLNIKFTVLWLIVDGAERSVTVIFIRSFINLRFAGVRGSFQGVTIVLLWEAVLVHDELIRVQTRRDTDISMRDGSLRARCFGVDQA